MKVRFIIHYITRPDEVLCVCGNAPEFGSGIKMHPADNGYWTATADIELPAGTYIEYGYVVLSATGIVRKEWGGMCHTLMSVSGVPVIDVYDLWHDCPAEKPFYSSAFVNCINRRVGRLPEVKPESGCLTIAVEAPTVGPDETLALCGADTLTGEWNPEKAVPMSDADYPVWKCNLVLNRVHMPLEFKFVVLDKTTGALLAWESGDNRRLDVGYDSAKTAVVVSGLRMRDSRAPWRGAGVAIPVFSVRTRDDFGVGDFYSLTKMVDWAVATGQKFLQILPINDTTMTHKWIDSYPYNACTTFGLHPMYLHVQELGRLKDADRQAYFDMLAAELNALPEVDYERVNDAKNQFISEIYVQEGSKTLKSAEFTDFLVANTDWLKPYAAFCVLRDKFSTPDFSRWGEFARYTPEIADRIYAAHTDRMNQVYYTQFHLDRQMRRVHDYACAHGVAFKGDIPIGISRHSADAWINPDLFNMDSQAGAPPDDFSVLGQNWGFPTYNWEEMQKDGFAWWKARFRKMSEFFDAYRIDHVLGFFRIWQIPVSAVHGLLGVFNPALPFSPDEMRESYGFEMNAALYTRPFIRQEMLDSFFGEFAEEARNRFLTPVGDGRFEFRREFDTQRKITDYFAGEEISFKNNRLCDGLLNLADEVLFIEDPYEKGKYHPRISASQTWAYRYLDDTQKRSFYSLYNDFFYHRHNDFWYEKAMMKLPPLIDSTPMLTCAEDLGMIPACVPAVMERLRMLALEIQRMPKNPACRFGNTWNYPYLSVCTTSTHDMGGIRKWWEDNPELAQQFYNDELHCKGEAPRQAAPWICDRIVMMNLLSPAMLTILPLQDWLSLSPDLRRDNPHEEEINIPSNPRHYWRYRMHIDVEDLIAAADFNHDLADRIHNAGRK